VIWRATTIHSLVDINFLLCIEVNSEYSQRSALIRSSKSACISKVFILSI
jgi:hypothetical protein